MSYQSALEAAGAKVKAFEHFGDWQGSWIAKVVIDDKSGWIMGSYGSCTVCDAFQSEFDCYDDNDNNYEQRLADFGKTYLDTIYSDNEIIEYLTRTVDEYDWDDEYKEQIKFVKENI